MDRLVTEALYRYGIVLTRSVHIGTGAPGLTWQCQISYRILHYNMGTQCKWGRLRKKIKGDSAKAILLGRRYISKWSSLASRLVAFLTRAKVDACQRWGMTDLRQLEKR